MIEVLSADGYTQSEATKKNEKNPAEALRLEEEEGERFFGGKFSDASKMKQL
jgi:hypothetical protein